MDDERMDVASPVPAPLKAAAALVSLEALGLILAAGVVVYDTITDTPDKVVRALLVPVLALGGAALLLASARSLLALRPGARSPLIVVQLLALPVGWAATFGSEQPLLGVPILVVAVAVLYLLFTPPAREVLDREPPG